MLGDERNSNTGVGLYNVEDHLCTDILQQVFYIVADEGVIIDCPPASKKHVLMSLCYIQLSARSARLCNNTMPCMASNAACLASSLKQEYSVKCSEGFARDYACSREHSILQHTQASILLNSTGK